MPIKDIILTIVSVAVIMGIALAPRFWDDEEVKKAEKTGEGPGGKTFQELNHVYRFPLLLQGEGPYDQDLLEVLQPLHCNNYLEKGHMVNRILSLQVSKRDDLQELAKPYVYTVLTLNRTEQDSMDFNVEIFQVSPGNETIRIANYGGARRIYSENILARTICLFVNK